MAFKRTIDEYCPRCGRQQVRRHGTKMIWYTSCPCDGVPGPPNPPKQFRLDEVIVNWSEEKQAAAESTGAPNRPLITEDWLRTSGFKWEQLDRQPSKHWLLWLAPACVDHRETGRQMFASTNDLGIELAFNEPEPSYWYCWVRADYACRYSRFLHVRHMLYQDEVIGLIEAMTGRKWNPADAMYGALHAPESAARLRKQADELHHRLAAEWGPRACADKKIEDDPSQIGIIGRDL